MAAYATGSSWSFPEDLPGGWVKVEDDTKTTESPADSSESGKTTPQPTPTSQPTSESNPSQPQPSQPQPQPHQHRQRTHYPPRQCRICLDTVHPTFKDLDPDSQPSGLSSSLPSAFQPTPHVVYESPPGDGGRLLRPCKCKGSQKYVHEECLRAWRLQDPLQKRNYWQCPTCQYKYQLRRLTWGSWISSTVAQIGLTLFIFISAMFILGFIADPIINLYVDPVGTIFSGLSADYEDDYYDKRIFPVDDEPAGWAEHFIKGLASLGLLGFAKFVLTLSPWHWFNMRGGGGIYVGGGGGRGNTGRDRLNQLSWFAIIVGIATFLFAVWKGVRAWSRRTLEKAGERVMDVPADLGGGDDDDDEDT